MSNSETADRLAHYQKHPKEAFTQGFTTRIHYEAIDSEVYEVHKYYLPTHALKKIRWVKKYFQALDEQDIDITYKRRKHWVEYGETALMMLGRIYHLCSKDYMIVAGSQFVSPVAWAVFGHGRPPGMARHQFNTILELANHYRNYTHGNCYPIDIHFRVGPHWAPRLGKNFKKPPLTSANFWMTIALLLTYDLIHECGPDCNEFFELFTNDYRESSDSFDVMAWEQMRCKILGVPGKVDVNRIPKGKVVAKVIRGGFVGPLEPPKKPFKAKVDIALVSESQDLAAGEKTKPTIIKVTHRTERSERHESFLPGDEIEFKGTWPITVIDVKGEVFELKEHKDASWVKRLGEKFIVVSCDDGFVQVKETDYILKKSDLRRVYSTGSCCPLPQIDLWANEDLQVGVHGLGMRPGLGHSRFRYGVTPDML